MHPHGGEDDESFVDAIADPTSQQLTTHDDDDEHDDNGTGRRRTHANPLHHMRDLVHEHGGERCHPAPSIDGARTTASPSPQSA